MSAPIKKVPSKKKTTASKPAVDPTQMAIGVVVVCVVGLLLAVWPTGEDSSNPALDAFLNEIGVQRRGVSVKCGNDGCYGQAQKQVQRGEPIMKVKRESIIEMQSIMADTKAGEIIRQNNGSLVTEFAEKSGLGGGFTNILAYAFYLIQERRLGSGSKWARFFDALPTEMKGAIFWDEEHDACLDESTAGEASALRKGLNMASECSEALCEAFEGGCPGGAPTKKEMQWAWGVYLANNFQDQAIIPGLNFFRFNNVREGAYPQWNEEDEVLDILAGEAAKKGDEVFSVYPRGPSGQLVSRGMFDKGSRGVDARIRIPDPEDKFLKRYCADKFHELQWGTQGRPRESLVTCIAAMVASPAQRKKFGKHRNDLELMMSTWGNLTSIIQYSLNGFAKVDKEACKPKDALLAQFADYLSFSQEIITNNARFVSQQHQRAVEQYQKQYPEAVPVDSDNAADEAPETP